MNDRKRTCSARGCDRTVAVSKLMCPHHWFRLPRSARDEVNTAWRAYCAGPSPITADALRGAQNRAIEAVSA